MTRIKFPPPRSAQGAARSHLHTAVMALGHTRRLRSANHQPPHRTIGTGGEEAENTTSLLIFSARTMKIMGRIDKDTSDTGGEAEREEGAEAQECQGSGRQRGSGDSPKGQHRRKGKNERRAVVEAGG
jgi:hypothetical protein